jgi:Flp pilus assembly protein TadG
MSLKRRAQKGQAAVELCFVLPICLLLFMGVYTGGSFISDLNVAGQATRAGSRLGAEVGNYGYGTAQALSASCMGASTTNPCAIDQDIVTTVATIAKSMQNVASIDEIDIYDPCGSVSSGSCTAANSLCTDTSNILGKYVVGDPVDVYTLQSGTWALKPPGPAGYPLNLRTQNHPNELAIGVRILYTFRASAPISFFNYQTSQYATMCLAPSESGA